MIFTYSDPFSRQLYTSANGLEETFSLNYIRIFLYIYLLLIWRPKLQTWQQMVTSNQLMLRH